ncbi:hypothetical protein V8E54_014493 [Elaphomyces granulatus]
MSASYPQGTDDGMKVLRGFLNIIAQATAENYVPIWLSLDFAISRWCDWTYVVDLDQNTFEVFRGQEQKQKASTTRFNDDLSYATEDPAYESSDDEVEINKEEVDKLLEEGTGGMGNTNDAMEADK